MNNMTGYTTVQCQMLSVSRLNLNPFRPSSDYPSTLPPSESSKLSVNISFFLECLKWLIKKLCVISTKLNLFTSSFMAFFRTSFSFLIRAVETELHFQRPYPLCLHQWFSLHQRAPCNTPLTHLPNQDLDMYFPPSSSSPVSLWPDQRLAVHEDLPSNSPTSAEI